MSRRIPPTPVAAPWNGSTALGWLCDSTLKAIARPSPTSTAPAFSPGPMTTRGPSVGSVRSSFLECLYAQCSLHSSENIASSTWFGARPSLSRISAYSSRVSPSATASPTDGSALGGDALTDRGLEQLQPVGRAGERVDRVLGVRHEPDDVALGVRDAGDVVGRPVGVAVVRVAEDHVEVGELLVGDVVAPARVLDRDGEDLAGLARRRPRRTVADDLDPELAADEAAPEVGQQRAGEQPRLAQDLEAVADAEHEAA